MKLLSMLLIVCGYLAAVQGAEKQKQSKAVKLLKSLCTAYNASAVVVRDSALEDVFGEGILGSFCDDFFDTLGEIPTGVSEEVDGIKLLDKACRWYTRKYDEEPTEGPLVGFEAICNVTEVAKASSLNDKASRKMLRKITGLCVAQEAGKLEMDESSANYSKVFEELDEFCDAFLNETTIATTERRGGSVDGVKVIGEVCTWYTEKFYYEPPQGSLGMLETVCEEYEDATPIIIVQ